MSKRNERQIDVNTIEVGKRIRAEREKQHLTIEQLAEKSNLHDTYIGRIERGEVEYSFKSLASIACALDVTVSEITQYLPCDSDSSNHLIIPEFYDFLVSLPSSTQSSLFEIATTYVNVLNSDLKK